MEPVIQISGITKKYGDFAAVDNLNLSISKGEVFGLLGPNGAGKSTTILMLMGLTEPDAGTLKVCGVDPVSHPIHVKKKVGYLPEDVGFYDDFSGLENLVYTARLNGMGREAEEKAENLLQRVGLGEEKHKKVGKYSRGMRQRLGLADVLIKDPEVIILDEPTLGIDPSGVREFLDLIIQLSRMEEITVLFSSHLLHQVQQVCDRVGLFVKGKLLALGNIESLSKQLFKEHNFNIEGEIELPESEKNGTIFFPPVLSTGLKKMKGISGLKTEDTKFFIESDTDLTAKISRFIVESGYGLLRLSKKEFGLDDIYHKYFEGARPE